MPHTRTILPLTSVSIVSAGFLSCCLAFAGDAPSRNPVSHDYWHAARGLNPTLIDRNEASLSLSRTVPATEHVPVRHPGSATPSALRAECGSCREDQALHEYQFLSPQPLTFMPYLDGLYNCGNIAVQPGAKIKGDILSTTAQYVKNKFSRIGITFISQTVVGYTGFAGSAARHGRRSYGSTHSSTVGNWTFVRERTTGNGLFGTAAMKQGEGFGFNATQDDPRTNVGGATDVSGYYQRQDVVLSQFGVGCNAMEGKLVVLAGMLDLGNYMDRNTYSGNSSGDLVNKAFVNGAALPVAIAGLGGQVAFQPDERLYFIWSSISDNTPPNQNPFDRASINNWINIVEIGLVRDDVMGLGKGVYRFQPFHATVNGESGYGLGLNFQQQLGRGSSYGWFFRGAWADPESSTITGVRLSAATGVVLHAPFSLWGKRDEKAVNREYVGLGLFWTEAGKYACNKTNQHEWGAELTYTMQLTPTMLIQPDIQLVHDPVYGKRRGQNNLVFQVQSIWVF